MPYFTIVEIISFEITQHKCVGRHSLHCKHRGVSSTEASRSISWSGNYHLKRIFIIYTVYGGSCNFYILHHCCRHAHPDRRRRSTITVKEHRYAGEFIGMRFGIRLCAKQTKFFSCKRNKSNSASRFGTGNRKEACRFHHRSNAYTTIHTSSSNIVCIQMPADNYIFIREFSTGNLRNNIIIFYRTQLEMIANVKFKLYITALFDHLLDFIKLVFVKEYLRLMRQIVKIGSGIVYKRTVIKGTERHRCFPYKSTHTCVNHLTVKYRRIFSKRLRHIFSLIFVACPAQRVVVMLYHSIFSTRGCTD